MGYYDKTKAAVLKSAYTLSEASFRGMLFPTHWGATRQLNVLEEALKNAGMSATNAVKAVQKLRYEPNYVRLFARDTGVNLLNAIITKLKSSSPEACVEELTNLARAPKHKVAKLAKHLPIISDKLCGGKMELMPFAELAHVPSPWGLRRAAAGLGEIAVKLPESQKAEALKTLVLSPNMKAMSKMPEMVAKIANMAPSGQQAEMIKTISKTPNFSTLVTHKTIYFTDKKVPFAMKDRLPQVLAQFPLNNRVDALKSLCELAARPEAIKAIYGNLKPFNKFVVHNGRSPEAIKALAECSNPALFLKNYNHLAATFGTNDRLTIAQTKDLVTSKNFEILAEAAKGYWKTPITGNAMGFTANLNTLTKGLNTSEKKDFLNELTNGNTQTVAKVLSPVSIKILSKQKPDDLKAILTRPLAEIESKVEEIAAQIKAARAERVEKVKATAGKVAGTASNALKTAFEFVKNGAAAIASDLTVLAASAAAPNPLVAALVKATANNQLALESGPVIEAELVKPSAPLALAEEASKKPEAELIVDIIPPSGKVKSNGVVIEAEIVEPDAIAKQKAGTNLLTVPDQAGSWVAKTTGPKTRTSWTAEVTRRNESPVIASTKPVTTDPRRSTLSAETNRLLATSDSAVGKVHGQS
jgi:hypothetical protein